MLLVFPSTYLDSFEKGMRKLKEAEEISDLNSDFDNNEPNILRRDIPKRKYLYSSSDDDDLPYKKRDSILPPFPTQKEVCVF